ncbi:hypothetical protein [Nocardioides humi]|uniref:Uncharacterized protein n=1 Tax=Nocardioides humi TaxID=449461 RepID=A0ABN2B3Q5_9ACTN|nr:hypothetical protein [Nocardioides humi]
MVNWVYEMKIPDDAPDEELDSYKQMAIDLWSTSTEMMGAHGTEPTVTLLEVEERGTVIDPVSREEVPGPRRVWRVEGSAL